MSNKNKSNTSQFDSRIYAYEFLLVIQKLYFFHVAIQGLLGELLIYNFEVITFITELLTYHSFAPITIKNANSQLIIYVCSNSAFFQGIGLIRGVRIPIDKSNSPKLK